MKAKLKKILKKYGVKAVYIFGSFVKGKKTPLSDIDIGVVFEDIRTKNKDPTKVFTDIYYALKESLNIKNQRLDLVYLQEAPFGLQMDAIKNGKILFSLDDNFRTDYEDWVMMKYLDWKYEDDMYNKEMVEAIGVKNGK